MAQALIEAMDVESLRRLYCAGAFPMADDSGRIEWYTTRRRALFPTEGIRVSRSLRRRIRQGAFEVTFDIAFEAVMRGCLRPEDNWITEDLIRACCRVFDAGWAHSCEVWLDGTLAGGVYGMSLGSCFTAESMFHRARDASKIALWALVERCRERGCEMFDAQVMNPHLASLGAIEVPQSEFLRRLSRCLESPDLELA